MTTEKAAERAARPAPSPEELDAFLQMSKEEIARLVLCLLIEEALKGQLAALLPPAPGVATTPEPEKTPRRSA